MNINFEYYKIFYHVAKASSISAAARELCISQPAVSQAVKALEQAIGIELFIRTKKGVSLTNAGEILYSHVAAGYESISLGEQRALTASPHGDRRDKDRRKRYDTTVLSPAISGAFPPAISGDQGSCHKCSDSQHDKSSAIRQHRLRYRHQSSSRRSSHGDQAGKGD